MTIELLVRGRFVTLPTATATALSSNSWTVRVPDPLSLRKRTRRGEATEDWDGAVFCIDGVETEPGLGSGGGRDHVLVSVWAV